MWKNHTIKCICFSISFVLLSPSGEVRGAYYPLADGIPTETLTGKAGCRLLGEAQRKGAGGALFVAIVPGVLWFVEKPLRKGVAGLYYLQNYFAHDYSDGVKLAQKLFSNQDVTSVPNPGETDEDALRILRQDGAGLTRASIASTEHFLAGLISQTASLDDPTATQKLQRLRNLLNHIGYEELVCWGMYSKQDIRIRKTKFTDYITSVALVGKSYHYLQKKSPEIARRYKANMEFLRRLYQKFDAPRNATPFSYDVVWCQTPEGQSYEMTPLLGGVAEE